MPATPKAGINKNPNINIGFNKMFKKNVYSVLDFSTEGFNSEKEFDDCLKKKTSIIEFAKNRKEIRRIREGGTREH